MKKKKPTYDLNDFIEVMSSDFKITFSARKSAYDLQMNDSDILTIIQSMDRKMFFKSMTSYQNHKIWQDVYHVPTSFEGESLTLYVKFTGQLITVISTDYTLLSFKEK